MNLHQKDHPRSNTNHHEMRSKSDQMRNGKWLSLPGDWLLNFGGASILLPDLQFKPLDADSLCRFSDCTLSFRRQRNKTDPMPIAAVIPTPHAPVELREVPAPALEPNSALLDVELSEV